MKMLKRFLICCLAVATVTAHAQEGPQGPPEELKRLDWMLGEWTGTFNWVFPGMEGSAPTTFKNEREGNFVKSSTVITMGEMTFTETAYYGWDPAKKRYSGWTFTNFAPMPRVEHSIKFTDTLVAFESEPWDVGMPDGPVVSRATLQHRTGDEIYLLIEFKTGETWTKAAEGIFKKK
jgi:hypothetical protein